MLIPLDDKAMTSGSESRPTRGMYEGSKKVNIVLPVETESKYNDETVSFSTDAIFLWMCFAHSRLIPSSGADVFTQDVESVDTDSSLLSIKSAALNCFVIFTWRIYCFVTFQYSDVACSEGLQIYFSYKNV